MDCLMAYKIESTVFGGSRTTDVTNGRRCLCTDVSLEEISVAIVGRRVAASFLVPN